MNDQDFEVYDFGYRLKELRKKKGLSQNDLASLLDVSKASIYRYENNLQTPSFQTVIHLAKLLNTSVDYLAGLNDVPMIKLADLTKEQEAAMYEFIRLFIDSKE